MLVARLVSPRVRILHGVARVRRALQERNMRKAELNRITAALRKLTPDQRKQVAAELASLDGQLISTAIIEGRFAGGAMCPHCESVRVIRNGHVNGLQRYRCRECSKTFSALTGTPLNRLHKRGKWLGQAEALQTGQPLRAVAGALHIHLSTAHRWRHRFLALPKALQPPALTGIAEADETVFLLSFKGKRSGLERKARKRGGKAAKRGLSQEQVPVLVARDRSGATMDCVLDTMTAVTLSAALKPFVANDVVLCTDGSKALAGAARDLGIEHHAVNLSAGIRVDGAWHVQNVNAYHSRLKAWVQKFRGVATRYLASYLGWFRALDREHGNGPKPQQWLALAIGGVI
jgi:transposase-like protein